MILTLEPAVAGLTAVLAGTPLTTRTLVDAVLLLAAMSIVELAGRRGSTPATGVPNRDIMVLSVLHVNCKVAGPQFVATGRGPDPVVEPDERKEGP